MTFQEWRLTRKDHDALSEDDAGVYAGFRGFTYDAGFIIVRNGDYVVPLPQSDNNAFVMLADAEVFLWSEWCGPEINGE